MSVANATSPVTDSETPDVGSLVEKADIDAATAEVAPVPLTPGQQLRLARESRNLQIDDVANILRFSPRQIELLEADRYDELPGSTLVRGFVRGYAKLLKIDAVPLLAALTTDVPASMAEVRPPVNMGEADDAGVIDSALGRAVPWGSLLAAAVVVLALGLVVYFVRTAVPGGLPFPLASTATEPAATPSAPPTIVPPTVVPSAAVPLPAPAEPETPAPATAVMPPVTPLILEFDDHSWIEVRDATQKVVFVGEYPKGTRQVVEGLAPFQLWVGKASGVRVTYGERSIDLKPFTREDVARLTVE